MPELPEVETVRRSLLPVWVGRRVVGVDVRRGDLRRPVPPGFAAMVTGRRVGAITRRAKYLLVHLEAAPGLPPALPPTLAIDWLLIHLGMSGSLRYVRSSAEAAAAAPLLRHDHVVFHLEGGLEVRFHDPRRFGLILPGSGTPEAHPLLAGLGREPLEEPPALHAFTGAWLHRALQARAQAIKPAIMDQKLVVGVGNIYASEALFCARIHPDTPAGALSAEACAALVSAIRAVLLAALESGGSTLRDYAAADGTTGYFQHRFDVYGRHGQACTACATEIQRTVRAGRATYHCPQCQPASALPGNAGTARSRGLRTLRKVAT